MALHDPVEDALNDRKKRARLVEAGAAIGTPDRNALDITRKFLGGGQQGNQQLPGQASPVASRTAFGQQGSSRPGGGGLVTQQPPRDVGGSLSDRFLNLPGPVGFAGTPQGQAMLQRILGSVGRRR